MGWKESICGVGRKREEDSAPWEPLPIFGFLQARQHSLEDL